MCGDGASNAHGGNFSRKPESKGKLGERMSGYDAKKEIELKRIACAVVDRIHLAQGQDLWINFAL